MLLQSLLLYIGLHVLSNTLTVKVMKQILTTVVGFVCLCFFGFFVTNSVISHLKFLADTLHIMCAYHFKQAYYQCFQTLLTCTAYVASFAVG